MGGGGRPPYGGDPTGVGVSYERGTPVERFSHLMAEKPRKECQKWEDGRRGAPGGTGTGGSSLLPLYSR